MFCDSFSTSAREAFRIEGQEFTDDESEAEMIWLRKGHTKRFPHLQPSQLINHFPNQTCLVNKAGLTETLKKHDRANVDAEMTLSDFYQESYRLHDPVERRAFFGQLPKVDQRDNLWIYKPGNESRGRGIEIMWRFNKLQRRYQKYGNRPVKDRKLEGIVQRYIRKPLLLDGRKSEMRIYWVVASLDPFLVLMYPETTVRLNSLPYQLDNFDNQLIHVTNVYQQKNHPDFDPNAVLKWRFADLGRYLTEELGIAAPDFLETKLVPQLNRMIAWVAKAGRSRLFQQYPAQGDCFAVFGADVILDENLQPWLTEIQKGPGLSFLGDPVKQHVIPPMLGEAARIAFEVRERRLKGKSLKNLKSVNRYQWAVNELQPELEFTASKPYERIGRRSVSSEGVALSS